jgi:ankyrin repeat protein
VTVTKQLIPVRCSVDLQDKNGCTPLLMTTKNDHTAIVEQLIVARCDVHLLLKNGLTLISIVTRNGHTPVVVMIQN